MIDDLREVVKGLSCISLLKSLNTFSKPGCICRAIIGKLLSKSLKERTSFFLTDDVDSKACRPLGGSFKAFVGAFRLFKKLGSMAGVILIGS